MTTFIVNDRPTTVKESDGRTTFKMIKKNLNLSGTKEGCGEGDCGACMVLLGEKTETGGIHYRAINSCLLFTGELEGKHVVTIEGLNREKLNVIQETFAEEFASQCGFCTPGFIIAITAFLINTPDLNDDEALNAIAGNICRCTGYVSKKKAMSSILTKIESTEFKKTIPHSKERIKMLVGKNVLPSYFDTVIEKMNSIPKKPEKELTSLSTIAGGGTDLSIQKRDTIEEVSLYFISQRNDLRGIYESDGRCFLGGNVTFEEMRNSPLMARIFPNIKESFKLIASLPIRNRATVAGNIVNASPIGDIAIFLLAQNSTLVLSMNGVRREIPLRNFYQGYKKIDKEHAEILEWIYFDMPNRNEKINFEKVSKRKHLDIASVNSALRISESYGIITDVAISTGGVGPIPLYLTKTCEFLKGKNISCERLRYALAIADSEISPISDIRGSEAYKRLLLRNLLVSHFANLFPETIDAVTLR